MTARPEGQAGYPGTPLPKKLGIKEGFLLGVIDEPPGFRALLGDLPASVELRSGIGREPDIVVLFVTERARLAHELPRAGDAVFPGGAIWVAWPKRASKVPTDITEDSVRELGLPMGLVDNKVCAISEVWSGLRLVWRKQLRGADAPPGAKSLPQ